MTTRMRERKNVKLISGLASLYTVGLDTIIDDDKSHDVKQYVQNKS